jgi:hypothetical protein
VSSACCWSRYIASPQSSVATTVARNSITMRRIMRLFSALACKMSMRIGLRSGAGYGNLG